MSTANGLLTNDTKNAMLSGFTSIPGGRAIGAYNANGDLVSDVLTIGFNSPVEGKMQISSNVSLTIDNNSVGANAIKFISVTNASATIIYIDFELDVPLEFPDGGSLIISSLEISLDDPS